MGKEHVEEQVKGKVHPKSKINRFQAKAQEQVEPANSKSWKTSAVIYIGHLPHGFLEQQLKSYFSQFGEVLAVKVSRSKKTARSKGYGFVQFEYPEVAEIAAKTMNNYLLLGRILQCHTLQNHKVNPFTFKTMKHRTKFINWKRIFVARRNKTRTPEQLKTEVGKLLEHEEQKRTKLKQLGLDYNFPGFQAIVKPKSKKDKKTN